ncbi:hypothetical protein BDP27DRAFT_1331467 [Rhodocollybia butyracea]|uniref:Secreted protein n=1 Tax=Rhodocollybia butyracea TaxID=206335 RepID=A0A9P5PNS3_9AGAR|nr:hypothetical protein BDP27DRAFT_1331467 [Rhodocollybia butyracea]
MFFSLLAISATAAAFFGSASAQQSCDDAARFGTVTFPNPIVLGESFGVPAIFSDYVLQATADPTDPNLLGFIPTVYFARRDVPANQVDSFNVTFDPAFFASAPGAEWQVVLFTTRVETTDSFGSTMLVGSVELPVTLVTASD